MKLMKTSVYMMKNSDERAALEALKEYAEEVCAYSDTNARVEGSGAWGRAESINRGSLNIEREGARICT